jgi:hypothetical protein
MQMNCVKTIIQVFQKDLYNFESLYEFILRTCRAF